MSSEEQRLLREIERGLTRTDPDLTAAFEDQSPRGIHIAVRRGAWIALAIIAAAGLVAGAITASPAVAFAGFVVALIVIGNVLSHIETVDAIRNMLGLGRNTDDP